MILIINEDAYLNYVMSLAEKMGKLFILDTGEGNDCIDPTTQWYIEDLSGWLISPDERNHFWQSLKNSSAYEEFSNSYIFVKWSKTVDGELIIKFID